MDILTVVIRLIVIVLFFPCMFYLFSIWIGLARWCADKGDEHAEKLFKKGKMWRDW